MNAMTRMAGALALATLLAACGGGNEGGNAGVAETAEVPVADGPAQMDNLEAAAAAVTQTADLSWVPTWDDAVLDSYYPSRPLTVQITGAGSVTNVAHGNAGPLCTTGANCVLKYGKYETVTLVAYAKPGMVFRGWSGGCIDAGMASTCKITNSISHTVLAVFAPA